MKKLALLVALLLTISAVLSVGWTPRPEVQAQQGPTGAFLATIDGAPTAPQPFVTHPDSARFDIAVHARDNREPPMSTQPAHHAATCADAGAQHSTTGSAESAVFVCNHHLMTAALGNGYSVIYLTPDRELSWENQAAVIQFDMSTFRSSERDWLDIWVTPWEHNLQLPLEELWPDLQGPPRHAIQVQLQMTNGAFCPQVWREHQGTVDVVPPYRCTHTSGWEGVLTPSKAQREAIRITISQITPTTGNIRVEMMPRANCAAGLACETPSHPGRVWFDGHVPLDFRSGVVQVGHHAYTPEKGTYCPPYGAGGSCGPNTWHLDNIYLNPATPFAVIKADRRFTTGQGTIVNFERPAPVGAMLRFSAWGEDIEWAPANGSVWTPAQRGADHRDDDSHIHNYWTPIGPGLQAIRLRGSGQLGGSLPFFAKDMSIWARGMIAPTPTPTPAALATTVPTVPPPATATPTPAPTATPIPEVTATPTLPPTPEPGATTPPVPPECWIEYRESRDGPPIPRQITDPTMRLILCGQAGP